ncbi:MAG: UDP-N-acetylmuramate--L-alanine ligase [Armatimonadetes bacterium 55-13]|nr:UDP-N-acetylmuramate--L-alanine ligase [Armatimonadota bacterium]OJU64805.1 MAG: UDP-N-acetylmuramate--L-alanine ligase [Armatimonadetes bacterium 55-13]
MRKAEEIASEFAPREALDGKTSFFLVGIGGAGMSALARLLKDRGHSVRGADSTASAEVDRLRSEGIDVQIGHSGEAIQADDAVVLTDAIDLAKSPEVARARELGLPLFRRSQALGWLLKAYKVIAVTGTHGKTTTTGMIGAGLKAAGLDPLIVVGANVPEFGGPVVDGKGEWAVVEACEAYDSFHDIDPWYVVLTNLEMDHVDFHGTYENLEASVLRFVNKAAKLFYATPDAGAREVAEKSSIPHVGYDTNDFIAAVENSNALIASPKQRGEHNLLNASGAIKIANEVSAPVKDALAAIVAFRGAERRQQVLRGEGVNAKYDADSNTLFIPPSGVPKRDVVVIDDYAHHPTEVRESLTALKTWYTSQDPESGESSKRLIVAFQPHLYSRTADFIEEFAEALSVADVVFLTDIYPAREAPMPGISSARIAEHIHKECYYIPSRHLLPAKVAAFAREGDVVVGMGAGNISEFAPAFIHEWERRMDLENSERPTKVAVVYGGDSSEREISILSGREVQASLARQGFDAELVDVTDLLLSKGDVHRFLGPDRPDVACLAVHGTHAEDGAVQGLLELLHIPYTGSGIQASALAMDKGLTKQILSAQGIRVPEGQLVTAKDQVIDLPLPLVVKPNAEGSTVGLSFVETKEQLQPAIERALSYGGSCLVEEWVKGMEISVPVLGDRVLPPVEIAPASGKYDFASKYTPGATEEIVPARIGEELTRQVQSIALKAHQTLRCQGATRTDMLIRNPEGNAEVFVLEVNTLPGMTSTSLLPNSAKAAGIDFDALTKWLVEDALARYGAKKA